MSPTAAHPMQEGVAHAAGDGGRGIFFVVEHVVIVELQDERNFAGVFGGAGLEESQRRGVGVASGVDRQLKMIARIVRGRIDREAARRSVLETLVHGQNHELARPRELAVVEHAGEIAPHAGIFGIVVAENFSNSFGHIPSLPRECRLIPISQHRRRAVGRAEQSGGGIQHDPHFDPAENLVRAVPWTKIPA